MAEVDQSAVKKYNCDMLTVLIYQHNMDCIKTEPDPDAEVYSASCSEIQYNMDCIKTEPDPVAEVHSTSYSEIQLVDIKQEEQPLSISFAPAKDGNDVSCQCVCC